jgi:hypothetical protein
MEPDAPIDNTTRRVPLTRDSETRRWDLLWRSWVNIFFLATSNKTAARGLYSHALGTKEKNEKMVLLLLPLWCGLFGFSWVESLALSFIVYRSHQHSNTVLGIGWRHRWDSSAWFQEPRQAPKL